MIRIASFNVKNLADGEGRDLDRIARIINNNHIDIVCLQEVLQEGKILNGINIKNAYGQVKAYDRSLISRLSGKWDSEWKMPTIRKENEQFLGGDKRGEGYAILWRTDNKKLKLPKDKMGNEVRPTIYTNYRPDKIDSELYLIREPLYARFIIGNRPAELRLISTHIVYGKNKALKDVIDYGAIEMRKKEFYMIAGQIYYRISEMYKDINITSPYTIMMGDYNLNVGSSLPFAVSFDKAGRVDTSGKGFFTINNLQTEKTTLKSNKPELANSYDHFSMDERATEVVVKGSERVVDAIHKYTQRCSTEEEQYDIYRKMVSDHLPIIMDVNL